MKSQFVRFAIALTAMLALIGGSVVAAAPTASAVSLDGVVNYKRNTKNIRMIDAKGKAFNVKPGEGSWRYSTKFIKKVLIPYGCVGSWSKGSLSRPLKAGWNTLPLSKQALGGTIYLWDPVGKKTTKNCSNYYRR